MLHFMAAPAPPKFSLSRFSLHYVYSMAGVTTGNVEYLANAIHEVTKSA